MRPRGSSSAMKTTNLIFLTHPVTCSTSRGVMFRTIAITSEVFLFYEFVKIQNLEQYLSIYFTASKSVSLDRRVR